MRHCFFLFIGLLLATAPVFAQDTEDPLIGEWTLFAHQDSETGSYTYPPTELHRPIKLFFQPDQTFNANSFRVYVSGKYTTEGQQLTLTEVNSSKNIAENTLGEKFRLSISDVSSYNLKADTLAITCKGGKETLHFLRGNASTDAIYKEHTALLATYEIPQALRDYFTPASTEGFWVFKEVNGGGLHSFYLDQFSNSYFRNGFKDHNREWIECVLGSDNTKKPILGAQLFAYSDEEVLLKFFFPNGNGINATDRCLSARKAFKTGGVGAFMCAGSVTMEPMVEVNGKTYKQVAKVTMDTPSEDHTLFQTAWFAKGIGLIRQDMSDGASYQLVRYTVK